MADGSDAEENVLLPEANIWLALAIFLNAVVIRVLHRIKPMVVSWIVSMAARESLEMTRLKRSIKEMKSSLDSIHDFAKRVPVFNEKKQAEENLHHLDKEWQKHKKTIGRFTNTVLTILFEASRFAVVLPNRYVPVVLLPPDRVWPLAWLLCFPTGIPGALGAPIWGLVCRQFLQVVLKPWIT